MNFIIGHKVTYQILVKRYFLVRSGEVDTISIWAKYGIIKVSIWPYKINTSRHFAYSEYIWTSILTGKYHLVFNKIVESNPFRNTEVYMISLDMTNWIFKPNGNGLPQLECPLPLRSRLYIKWRRRLDGKQYSLQSNYSQIRTVLIPYDSPCFSLVLFHLVVLLPCRSYNPASFYFVLLSCLTDPFYVISNLRFLPFSIIYSRVLLNLTFIFCQQDLFLKCHVSLQYQTTTIAISTYVQSTVTARGCLLRLAAPQRSSTDFEHINFSLEKFYPLSFEKLCEPVGKPVWFAGQMDFNDQVIGWASQLPSPSFIFQLKALRDLGS